MDARVGVVGAGITGLALTHHLRGRGVGSVTFEAADRPGGVVRTETVDGRVLEVGPQRTRLTDGVAELVDDVGLRDELVVADEDLPLYVYFDGRLRRVPFSVREFLATDLLSRRGKLRVLAEPLTGPVRPGETAAGALSRKFGREAYENLVGPLFGGTYGSDPAAMPAEHALRSLMAIEEREGSLLRPALRRAVGGGETPPPVSFADGLQRLPEALYEASRDRVHLATPVTAIREDGDGYVLVTPGGETAVEEVVLTTPAGVTADLLADLAPGAAGLGRLTYNSLAMAFLAADCDREGFGYQVRWSEPFETLGVSWNASMFDRDGVYTAFLGGMKRPDAVDAPADDLRRIAREEFEAVTGCEAEVLHLARLREVLPAFDDTWDALDGLDLPAGIRLATNYTARIGVPGRVREARRVADELAGGADERRAARPA